MRVPLSAQWASSLRRTIVPSPPLAEPLLKTYALWVFGVFFSLLLSRRRVFDRLALI